MPIKKPEHRTVGKRADAQRQRQVARDAKHAEKGHKQIEAPAGKYKVAERPKKPAKRPKAEPEPEPVEESGNDE